MIALNKTEISKNMPAIQSIEIFHCHHYFAAKREIKEKIPLFAIEIWKKEFHSKIVTENSLRRSNNIDVCQLKKRFVHLQHKSR